MVRIGSALADRYEYDDGKPSWKHPEKNQHVVQRCVDVHYRWGLQYKTDLKYKRRALNPRPMGAVFGTHASTNTVQTRYKTRGTLKKGKRTPCTHAETAGVDLLVESGFSQRMRPHAIAADDDDDQRPVRTTRGKCKTAERQRNGDPKRHRGRANAERHGRPSENPRGTTS